METITLRTKAQRLQTTAVEAIEKILSMPQDEARKFVWNAWCDYCGIAAGLGLDLSETDAQLFANELRYQFQVRYPEKTLGSEMAFLELAKATNNVVASEIRGKILEYSWRDLPAIRRAGYLLRSDNEKHYFGGFKELGFSNTEAERLKAFHCQISQLFEEIMTGKYPEYPQVEEDCEVKVKNSGEKKKSSSSNVSTVSTVDKIPEEKTNADAVTANTILANSQDIEEFYRIVERLGKSCITPELLEKQEPAIRNLLNASKLFG